MLIFVTVQSGRCLICFYKGSQLIRRYEILPNDPFSKVFALIDFYLETRKIQKADGLVFKISPTKRPCEV
jgi:hypothetical protein